MINSSFFEVNLKWSQFVWNSAPSASPLMLRCSTSGSHTIDLTWEAPPSSEQNGNIRHYKVHYELISLQYGHFPTNNHRNKRNE